MTSNKISIIIPCYNQAEFLPEALNSILSQTHENWECIVINDGSTDTTEEVASTYKTRDPRFQYYSQSRTGQSGARNLGLSKIKGDFVQFLDADDFILRDKFKVQLESLSAANSLRLSYTDYYPFNHSDGKRCFARISPRLSTKHPLLDIIYKWETAITIPIHSFLFDARFFTRYSIRFDEKLMNHPDWDCWINVFRLSPQVFFVNKKLAVYRVHSRSITREAGRKGNFSDGFISALQKNEALFPPSSKERQLIAKKIRLTHRMDFRIFGLRIFRGYHYFRLALENVKIYMKDILKLSH